MTGVWLCTWPSEVKFEFYWAKLGDTLGCKCGTCGRGQGSAWHWCIGQRIDYGVGAGKGCAWKRGLVGIIAWELNHSHENLKTHGKSLMQ